MTRSASVALTGLFLAACGDFRDPTSDTMAPGQDCLACHRMGGVAKKPYTVAGTVFPAPDASVMAGVAGAQVVIADASGNTLTLVSNEAGNFFTGDAVAFPASVEVRFAGRVAAKASPLTSGACNSCHTLPPAYGAAGRIAVP